MSDESPNHRLLPLQATGISGRALVHSQAAVRFKPAPTTKNGVVEPVNASRYGNARLVMKDPMLPAMFIVPDTAPAFARPMSMQNAQAGGRVMSEPNIASVKHSTAGSGLLNARLASIPVAARMKPKVAG